MKFGERSSAHLAAGLAAAVAWHAGGALAQGTDGISGFNPQDNCAAAFERTNDLGKVMIAAWVYGYLAASQGDLAPVDIANAKTRQQHDPGLRRQPAAFAAGDGGHEPQARP